MSSAIESATSAVVAVEAIVRVASSVVPGSADSAKRSAELEEKFITAVPMAVQAVNKTEQFLDKYSMDMVRVRVRIVIVLLDHFDHVWGFRCGCSKPQVSRSRLASLLRRCGLQENGWKR